MGNAGCGIQLSVQYYKHMNNVVPVGNEISRIESELWIEFWKELETN